jgi:AraC family transcriptional regulator, L-rhamnose operon transcriptional activator RhaR
MNARRIPRTNASDLSWLTAVRESLQPLREQFPIWVRHGIVHSGPTVPHPERHPYCEFSTVMEGTGNFFVGHERVERLAGDYFLAGPGVAHWYEGTRYPVRFAAVYFLPCVLIEMGPMGDGMKILQRLSARQSLADRLFRPPAALKSRFCAGIDEMIMEFDRKDFGHEMRLRARLMDLLVEMVRWECKNGRQFTGAAFATGWMHLEPALGFLREHFTEDIYARDLAAVAGVSQSRLKVLFHEILGVPWTRYLLGYRIHRAAALLTQPGHRILESALAVGFGSLSHFNAAFRSVMGVAPSVYAKTAAGKSGRTQ